jgi:IS30 family transposase
MAVARHVAGATLTSADKAALAGARPGTGVSQKELAAAFGVSKGAISQQVKRGMPTTSVEAAAEWRAINLRRMKATVSAPGMGRVSADASLPAMSIKPTEPVTEIDRAPNVRLCQRMIDTFAALGNVAALQTAFKNMSAARAGEKQNLEWEMERKKMLKELVSRDEVMCACAGEVAEWRRMLLSLGARLTGRITPDAARVVDAAVDEIMKRTDMLEPLAESKFTESK